MAVQLRSVFSFTIEPPFICIVDHDEGCSVTNDAENVIAYLVAKGIAVDDYVVIYRDTQFLWDRLLTDLGTFAGYAPLRAFSKDEAKAKVTRALNDAWRLT